MDTKILKKKLLKFQVLIRVLTVIFISIVISIAFANSFVALSIFNFCPVCLSCPTDCWTPRRVLLNSLYLQHQYLENSSQIILLSISFLQKALISLFKELNLVIEHIFSTSFTRSIICKSTSFTVNVRIYSSKNIFLKLHI